MTSTRSFGLRAATLLFLFGSTNALREGGQCKPNTFLALGCYVDGENGRALTGYSWQNGGLTTKACRRSCSKYQYFGVENGHECFCGNSLAASVADARECNLPCGGNSTETCGAVNRLNVYENKAFGPSSSVVFSSVVFSSVSSSSVASSSVASLSAASSHAISSSSSVVSSASSSSVSSGRIASSRVASIDAISSSAALASSSVPATSSETLTPAASLSTVSTTATPISSSVPTIASSTSRSSSSTSSSVESTTSTSTSTTSTTSLCPLATTVLVGNTPCWASMPDACSSLIKTPSIPWPAVTNSAIACSRAFTAPVAIPALTSASCFVGLNLPNYNAASAYSCVQNAGVICATATACSTPTPAPTNIVANGGFDSGALSPWILISASGAESVLGTSLAIGTAYGGRYALKMAHNNAAGISLREWKQDSLQLEPGATYAMSYRFYQSFGQSAIKTSLRFGSSDTSSLIFKTFDHFNTPAGVWTKVADQFVAPASFGTVVFGVRATQGGGPNTIYVDNITIQKVVT